MKRPLTWRGLLYAVIVALAAAAVFAPPDPAPPDTVQPARRSAAAGDAPAPMHDAGPWPGLQGLQATQTRGLPPPQGDPFESLASRSAAAAEAAAAASAPPAAPAKPGPPALPFVYLGRWVEQGRTAIFVRRGDRTHKIEQPGPLDADYAVQAIDGQQLVLRHLPTDQTQALRLDAPAAPAPAAMVATQEAAPEPEPDPSEN